MREGRHVEERHSRRRLNSPTTWIAAVAAACVTGAIALSMSPANAEASSTTATLTLTGIVDSSCDLGTGGTTDYVAPGGTVTIKASLAGASVTIPATLLTPAKTIPLNSSKVASFVDTVVIDGDTHHPHKLTRSTDKIVLRNVRTQHKLQWKATAVNLLGAVTVPLNGNNVNLPAGGELDWSGYIIPSAHSKCGVAIALPTTKVSAGGKTVTLPGVGATLPNPVPSLLSKLPKLPSVPAVGGKSKPASHGKKSPSTGVKYTPPALTVPQQVMPHAVSNGGGGGTGGGGGGFAAPGGGSGNGGGGDFNAPAAQVSSTAGPVAAATSAQKVKPAKTVDLASKNQLGGQQLPVLLAILAILALAMVTATYARLYLMRRNS